MESERFTTTSLRWLLLQRICAKIGMCSVLIELTHSFMISPSRRPEASQRNREFVTIPKALERCAAWANEKNTKMELVIGFRKTRVFQEWHAASQQDLTSTDSNATPASLRQTAVLGTPTCDGLTNHSQDTDNGDPIEAKKRRGVGTNADDVADNQKPGLLEKVLNFVHPTKSQ